MNTSFDFAENISENDRETFATRMLTLAAVLESLPRGQYTTLQPITFVDPSEPQAGVANAVGHAILNKELFPELALVAKVNEEGEPLIVKAEKPEETATAAEFERRVNQFFGPNALKIAFNSFEVPPKRVFAIQRLRQTAWRRYGYKAA